MDSSVNLAYFSHPDVVLDYARAAVNVGLWDSEKILFEKYLSRDAKILELGCGAGRAAFGLAKLGYSDITATDFAPPMVEMAQEINLRERANITFCVADATALAFPDASFDAAVFAFNGLQMIPQKERREQALREIFRVLKPGGIFIFTGHDRSVPARKQHWENERSRWENNSRDPALDDFGDWNHQTPSGAMFIHSAEPAEMRATLEHLGFSVLFSELRSRICPEPDTVREFSDDTRFWVLQKNALATKKLHVTAAVIVREDGKILCAKRGNAKNPYVAQKWEFPGGKVETGESPQSALARELLEEMDLQIRVGEKIMTVVHAYPNCEIEMDAFFCVPATESTDFVLREHADACWLPPDALDTLDWAPADLPIVKKLSSHLQISVCRSGVRS